MWSLFVVRQYIELSFCWCVKAEYYPYYGTNLDDMDHLDNQANQHTSKLTAAAAQFAGQMALRLVHDHLLSLDVSRYKGALNVAVSRTKNQLSKVGFSLTLLIDVFCQIRSQLLKKNAPEIKSNSSASFEPHRVLTFVPER